jgi:hypothetical protein
MAANITPAALEKLHNGTAPDIRRGQLESVVALKMWPTPCATDYKGAGRNGELRDRLDYAAERGGTKSNKYPEPPEIGGQLNPAWVEWLMGWPLGWTDLKPLEMDKSHCAPQQHGES